MSARLSELADLIANGADANVVLWTDEKGGVIEGEGLFVEPPGDDELHPGGAVVVCTMEEGQVFPAHKQEYCTEILTVLGGLLEVSITEHGEGVVILGPGMHVALQPGVVHRVKALAATTVIGVTVPKDGGYPNAAKHSGGVRSGDG